MAVGGTRAALALLQGLALAMDSCALVRAGCWAKHFGLWELPLWRGRGKIGEKQRGSHHGMEAG